MHIFLGILFEEMFLNDILCLYITHAFYLLCLHIIHHSTFKITSLFTCRLFAHWIRQSKSHWLLKTILILCLVNRYHRSVLRRGSFFFLHSFLFLISPAISYFLGTIKPTWWLVGDKCIIFRTPCRISPFKLILQLEIAICLFLAIRSPSMVITHPSM